MGVKMELWNLLPAARLCVLLVAMTQVESCPESCRVCSGPGNKQCVECRPGWMLHNNACVGTVCGADHGHDIRHKCVAGKLNENLIFFLFQTLMSVALSWTGVLRALTALTQRVLMSAKVSSLCYL